MQLTTLRRLLIDELQEIYISESLIEEALGRMEIGAHADEVKAAFKQHREQTGGHIERLNTVFSRVEASPRGGRGLTIKAILRESEDRLGMGGDPHVVDASLIVVAQRVEHWEIASYGAAQMFAATLQQPEVAELLGKTLEEEKAADAHLSDIAGRVNEEASVAS